MPLNGTNLETNTLILAAVKVLVGFGFPTLALFFNLFVIIVSLVPKLVQSGVRYLFVPVCLHDTLHILAFTISSFASNEFTANVADIQMFVSYVGHPLALLPLAFTRYLAIRAPFLYRALLPVVRQRDKIGVASFVFLLPYVLVVTIWVGQGSGEFVLGDAVIWGTILVHLLLLVLYLDLYIRMWRLARQQRRNSTTTTAAGGDSATDDSRRLLRTLFLLGILPFLLQAPYLLGSALHSEEAVNRAGPSSLLAMLHYFSHVCFLARTFVDPLCIVVTLQDYKAAFRRFLCCCLPKNKVASGIFVIVQANKHLAERVSIRRQNVQPAAIVREF